MHVMDGALLSAKKLFNQKDALKQVRAPWNRAKRFIFDEDASAWIGRFNSECPDIILSNLDFAIPPYETVYIEINATAAKHGAASARTNPYPDRRGYLITDDGRVIYTSAVVGARHALMPILYSLQDTSTHLAAPDDPDYELSVEAGARFYLGAAACEAATPEQRLEVASRYDWATFVMGLDEEERRNFLIAQQGDLGMVLSALLLLNQRRNIEAVHVPASRRLIGNKTWPYAAHNRVSINVDPGLSIRGAFKIEDRASPRRHEVRGHFMHTNITEGCEHEWVNIEIGRKWECELCGGRRTWRAPHQRGDAGRGYVTKDYEVGS